jgi:hypothetical protein
MKYVQDYAELFANRLNADLPSWHGRSGRGGRLVALPARRWFAGFLSWHHLPRTAEDRAPDRRRLAGMAAFYAALVLISGAIAVLIDSGVVLTGVRLPRQVRRPQRTGHID